MSEAVKQAPDSALRADNYVLLSWFLASGGRIDRQRQLVSIGALRDLPGIVGIENISSIRGDFALAVGRPDGLLVARGRFASRCLYFARLPDGGVAACSRLEPLAACLDHVTPNVRTLAALVLARASEDMAATVFNEISRVDAAQAILLGQRGPINSVQAGVELTPRRGSPDELAEELHATLRRVVERSLKGTRRVAVLVSGGLDSSGVLAHAVAIARHAKRPQVDAISWSFGGPGDDRPYFRELCDSLCVRPVLVSTTEASANVLRALTVDASPFIWATSAGILTASDRARELGADAVLTGMGGDEVFGGDRRAIAQRVWSRHFLDAFPRTVRLCQNSNKVRMLRLAKLLFSPIVAQVCPAAVLRLRRRRHSRETWPWAGSRLTRVIRELHLHSPLDRDYTNEGKMRSLAQKAFIFYAENRRQFEAASGVRHIDPLLDDELVALLATFPQDVLLFGDRQRGLYRHATQAVLPERLRLRRDKGQFEPAAAEMVRGSDIAALTDLANMRMLGDLQLVEPVAYGRCFDQLLSGARDDWATMWPPLAVEAFVRARWGAPRAET
jgi:asparagine synthetase B (glutamine-hydrolysing)